MFLNGSVQYLENVIIYLSAFKYAKLIYSFYAPYETHKPASATNRISWNQKGCTVLVSSGK